MKNTMKGPLADSIERYLAHKHALGKQLDKGRCFICWMPPCSPTEL